MALLKVGGFPGYALDESAASGLNQTNLTIAAKAGGGQSGATLLDSAYDKVITVATAGDSVLLVPASNVGVVQIVNNAAANSCNVFPNTGDAINALGANNAFALAAAKNAMFVCIASGQWLAILSA